MNEEEKQFIRNLAEEIEDRSINLLTRFSNENAVALTVSRSYLKEIIVRAKAIKSVTDF